MTSEELRAAQEYTRTWGCFPNQLWEGVTAQEAIELAGAGIVPCGFIPREPMWASPYGGDADAGGGGSYEPINEPAPIFSAAEPISVDVVDSLPKEADVIKLASGPTVPDSFWGVISQGISILPQLFQDTVDSPLGPLKNPFPQFGQQPQIPTFSTGVVGGPGCWDNSESPVVQRRRLLRRTVRMQRFPDGSIRVVQGCRPRRMNPLNARALGRAARRLSSFHKISKHIEKIVQRACKGTSRRAPRMSYGGSCRSRKRC